MGFHFAELVLEFLSLHRWTAKEDGKGSHHPSFQPSTASTLVVQKPSEGGAVAMTYIQATKP